MLREHPTAELSVDPHPIARAVEQPGLVVRSAHCNLHRNVLTASGGLAVVALLVDLHVERGETHLEAGLRVVALEVWQRQHDTLQPHGAGLSRLIGAGCADLAHIQPHLADPPTRIIVALCVARVVAGEKAHCTLEG